MSSPFKWVSSANDGLERKRNKTFTCKYQNMLQVVICILSTCKCKERGYITVFCFTKQIHIHPEEILMQLPVQLKEFPHMSMIPVYDKCILCNYNFMSTRVVKTTNQDHNTLQSSRKPAGPKGMVLLASQLRQCPSNWGSVFNFHAGENSLLFAVQVSSRYCFLIPRSPRFVWPWTKLTNVMNCKSPPISTMHKHSHQNVTVSYIIGSN